MITHTKRMTRIIYIKITTPFKVIEYEVDNIGLWYELI